jgi:hypothetical protein
MHLRNWTNIYTLIWTYTHLRLLREIEASKETLTPKNRKIKAQTYTKKNQTNRHTLK